MTKLSVRLRRDICVPTTYIEDAERLEREIERLNKAHDHQSEMAGLMLREAERHSKESDALRADAERYRWLKTNIPIILSDVSGDIEIEKLDAAIDAAMKEKRDE